MGHNRKKKQTEGQAVVPEEEAARREGNGKGRFRKCYKNNIWFFRGVIISLLFAILFSCFYGVFRARAEVCEESPLETRDNITWLFQSCYLLYRDLHNVSQEELLDYTDIYLEPNEEYDWILDERQMSEYNVLLDLKAELENMEAYGSQENAQENWLANALQQGLITEERLEEYIVLGDLDRSWLERYLEESNRYNLSRDDFYELRQMIETIQTYFGNLETGFRNLNSSYDYIIEDLSTGRYVTNMSVEDRNRQPQEQYFLLSFTFDNAGNVSIGDDICGKNESYIRKVANEAVRESSLRGLTGDNTVLFYKYGKLRPPVNCRVTFSISKEVWETQKGDFYVGIFSTDTSYDFDIRYYSSYYDDPIRAYVMSGLPGILLICMLFMALLGLFLPLPSDMTPWKTEKICSLPFEILFCVGCAIFLFMEPVIALIGYVAEGEAGGAFAEYLGDADMADFLVGVMNLTAIALFFFCCWYLGICARALREFGVKEYIKCRSLIYGFFPYMKRKVLGIYGSLAHMDLTHDSNITIIKLLLLNGVVLFLISCLWYGGFAITLVYSIVLYVVLRKYISELQKRYRILLKAVDEIAEGNLNVTIHEDLGVFEPFRKQVFKIQDGLQKAVDMEVRSQRMKVELVTNMSHDLKTPLTAIITYINLLKDPDITEEQRTEYMETLERKSLRLKSLIEDLFEFSKANSQNITLNIMDVDIMNLVKQVAFEMSDKIDAAGLDVRMNLTEEKVILPLDSQKTFRIYENLFGNITKYALPGTRVYVNGFRIDDTVVITLKNISAQEITVEAAELTERFVRGDASRNTEGSGLGLAIAKSFTELQGGQLTLEVDGDLFKVTTTWHFAPKEEPQI